MRIWMQALGCRLNEAEVETWSRAFRAQGHEVALAPEAADLVVVNTCAVTAEAVRKSRKVLSRAHKANPAAKLVLTGCWASLEPISAAGLAGVDLVIDNARKDRLPEIVQAELDLDTMPVSAIEPDEPALFALGRQRAFVKVQDGCRHQCSFCIVTAARGAERSRPIAEVIEEIDDLVAQGVQEALLTGVQLGGYGAGIDADLAELVRAILAYTDLPRLRLGALEPWDLPAGFWRLFEHPRLMPHLHLPLQSGSDRILRLMARRCKREGFRRLAAEARAASPAMNLTTDIIAGFPGEGDADWGQTLSLCEEIGFGHIHTFAFSPRPGTRAAELPDPVAPEVIRARSHELHELAVRLRRGVLERYVGQTFDLLIEGGGIGGYTPNYLRVDLALPAGAEEIGRIRPVRLDRVAPEGDRLIGEVIPDAPDSNAVHLGDFQN